MKRLYKSRTDRKICGVCGGIAEYFNIDPTIVRIIWAIFVLVFGSGILAYFIVAFILPDSPPDGYTEPIQVDAEESDGQQ